MYHRELSTLMVQSLFTDERRQKHLARTNRGDAASSTDILHREFRNTRGDGKTEEEEEEETREEGEVKEEKGRGKWRVPSVVSSCS